MSAKKLPDATSRKVLSVLRDNYLPEHPEAAIDVYRYNSASVRVRIVSPHFANIPHRRRDKEVWPVLKAHLSDDAISQISLLLLLTPSEQRGSLMNLEFDDPLPSRL